MSRWTSQCTILVCFLNFVEGPRLTFDHSRGITGITIKPGGSGLPVPPRHTAITVPSPHIPPQNDPLTKVNSPVKIDPPVETGPPAKVDPPTELEPPAKAEPPVEEQSGCRCVIM